MKKIKYLILLLLLVIVTSNVSTAAASDTEWYWISSDTKYSKFFAPERVRVLSSVQSTPVQIEAWTKTVYSYAGAAETINNYGINATIPNPSSLSYSLARIEINPQNRLLTYMEEIFYDAQGNVLWSKNDPKPTAKEINSRSFDQDFYCMIIDQVFKQNEFEKINAADRWLTLWQTTTADGGSISCWADTMTMRQHDENVVLWEWEDTKNAAGQSVEIKFRKKAYNLPNSTAKVIRYNYWSGTTGWTTKESDLDGRYYSLIPDSNEETGAKALKKYVEAHKDWVTRYMLKDGAIDTQDAAGNDEVKQIIKKAAVPVPTSPAVPVPPVAPVIK